MKVQAKLPNLRISPRKVRLVTRGLVGIDVQEALIQLSKQTKKSSGHLVVLLKSAISNAVNNFGLSESNLYVLDVRVGDGTTVKRWLPRAFGRATPLLRRGCNVTLILEEKIEGKDRVAPKEKVTKVVAPEEALEETKESKKNPGKPALSEKSAPVNVPTKAASAKKVFQRKSI